MLTIQNRLAVASDDTGAKLILSTTVENSTVAVWQQEQAKGVQKTKPLLLPEAAMGFGEGIARCLLKEVPRNIVVADMNESVEKPQLIV